MLAAIVLGLFMSFGGQGGSLLGTMMMQHVTDQTRKNIADEERRKLALKGLSVVNDDVKWLNDQLSKDLGQMEKLIKDYDSRPEDFDRLFSSVLAKRQDLVARIWDDRPALLQHVRPDEWQAIMSEAKTAMGNEAAAQHDRMLPIHAAKEHVR